MELTIYDPGLDPERSSAARLASLLERVLTHAHALMRCEHGMSSLHSDCA